MNDILDLQPVTGIESSQLPSLAQETVNESYQGLDHLIAQIDQMMEVSAVAATANSRPDLSTQVPVAANNSVTTQPQAKYVVFVVAGTRYAVQMGHLVEVGRLRSLTPLPGAPDWMLGLTNLRGDVISVTDCRALFQLDSVSQPEMSRMCVVQTEARDLTTGLIVDRVEGLTYLVEGNIQEMTLMNNDGITPWLRGVYQQGNKVLNVLNLEKALRSLESAW